MERLRDPALAQATRLASADHRVEFYDSDTTLAETVAGLVQPVTAADVAIIIATGEHARAITAALAGKGLDVSDAVRTGRLVTLDASETLGRILYAGALAPARFHDLLGGLLERATRAGQSVRVYGEMVTLLWDQDRVAETMELEQLWNELIDTFAFGLVCGYPTAMFARPDSVAPYHDICAHHTAVGASIEWRPGQGAESTGGEGPDAAEEAAELHQLRRHNELLHALLQRSQDEQRAHDELSAAVLHELATPTTIIKGFLHTLQQGWRDLEPGETDEFLQRAMVNVRRLERLAHDLLTVRGTPDAGLDFDLRPTDLIAVIQRAIDELRGLTNRRIELVTQIAPPAMALVDEDRQLQILHNLLHNAVKFSPETTTVEVSLIRREEGLEVQVRDRGTGIPPAALSHLFEPFTRMDNDYAEAGTGLGLYIAKRLVEGQGGHIRVDDHGGDGATVSYTVLPVDAS